MPFSKNGQPTVRLSPVHHLLAKALGFSVNVGKSWLTGYSRSIFSNSGRKRQNASLLPFGRSQCEVCEHLRGLARHALDVLHVDQDAQVGPIKVLVQLVFNERQFRIFNQVHIVDADDRDGAFAGNAQSAFDDSPLRD